MVPLVAVVAVVDPVGEDRVARARCPITDRKCIRRPEDRDLTGMDHRCTGDRVATLRDRPAPDKGHPTCRVVPTVVHPAWVAPDRVRLRT